MLLQKNALSVLLITTSLLSLCLHLVKFFCNFISTVTTDGVIPSCNGANISMTDRTFSVGTNKCFLGVAN